jgi:hypothetical protein
LGGPVPNRFDGTMGEIDLLPLLRVESVDDVWKQVIFLVVDVGHEKARRVRNSWTAEAVGEPAVQVVVLAA